MDCRDGSRALSGTSKLPARCLAGVGAKKLAADTAGTELDDEWTLPASRNKTKVDLVRPLSAEAWDVLPDRIDQRRVLYGFCTKRPHPVAADGLRRSFRPGGP